MVGKILDLRFPLAGVVRKDAFQDASLAGSRQHPGIYGSPWAVNCRSRDPIARRMRGGSRLGIAAGGTPIPTPSVTVVGGSVSTYNEATGSSTAIIPTEGSLPESPTNGVIYRARLVLSAGNVLFASRLGNFLDFDYGADAKDSGAATMWQLSEADEIGQDVTAIIPFKDELLILATDGEMWVLQGDPVTGRLRNISRSVGIVGKSAWFLSGTTLFFMAEDGLWAMGADGSGMKHLSSERIPDELRGLPGDDVVLAYNPSENGVYVFVQGETYQWFYDLEAGAFWPLTVPAIPTGAGLVDGSLYLDCNGSAYQIGGSESFTSHVVLGPLALESGIFARVMWIQGAVAEQGSSVTWSLVPGDTAEEACENGVLAIGGDDTKVVATGTIPAGRSHRFYPKCRAPWFVVWLSGSSAWAFESLSLEIVPAGTWR